MVLSRRPQDPDHRCAVQPVNRLWRRQGVPARGRDAGLHLRQRRTQGSGRQELPERSDPARYCAATSAATRTSTRCLPRFAASGGGMDGLLHSIAYAPRESLGGDYLDTLSREAFAIAHDIRLVQLRGIGQGRPAADGRSPGIAGDLVLSGRRSLGAELQRHGARQGEPRVECPLPCRLPGSGGHSGQRHLGRSDQDAGRCRDRQFRKAALAFRAGGAAASQRHHRRDRQRCGVSAVGFASAITGEICYADCGYSTVAVGASED